MRTTLLLDRAIKPSEAKVHVYSDSVLCLRKMHAHPTASQKWEEQIGFFMNSKDDQELCRIDGELEQAAIHLGNDYFGEFSCNQKSATKNSETIVRCDKEVGQGSERNPRYIRDRLATQFLEKDDFVERQSSPTINSKNLRIPYCAWEESVKIL